jgi:uncharacterized protein (TIGR02270 family)
MMDVLIEHFEELDFLWEQRERMVFAWDWSVDDLAELEERAEAHLDALRIGGDAALEIARPSLIGEEVGAATAAAFAFLASPEPPRAREVVRALQSAQRAAIDGIRIALRHSDVRGVEEGLYDLAVGPDPMQRAAATDVLTFRRMRPPPEIDRLLAHDDPDVRVLAYASAGRAERVLTARHLETALTDSDSRVRRVALESAARCALPELPSLCREAARGVVPVAEAVEFLGVLGERNDLALLESSLGEPALALDALRALADLGSAAIVPALLEAIERPGLGDTASAAFTQITAIEVPRRPVPQPAADQEDDDEPRLDLEAARAAWRAAKPRFSRTRRYQGGMDVDALTLPQLLRVLHLRSRRVSYLGRRLRDRQATPDVELERRVRAVDQDDRP